MSLRKRNIIGFTILNAHMIAILILDLANITSFEWLPTFFNDSRDYCDNILCFLCRI